MTRSEPLFRKGDRLELLAMPNDPCPVPVGTKGTVVADSTWVDYETWQTRMQWDDGRTLAIVSPIDKVRKI
ncbi:DUF4314 domain-containing protein [Mesorhizobium sp. M0955]|uniref:DUF4314 domain-containing protein n=1 Tax=Mesorhizobium sp. M0955 TaxID=2957033 RepID=UPI00333818C2